MTFTTEAVITTFGGKLMKLSHESKFTNTMMEVNLFLPSSYFSNGAAKVPVLLYLAGLSCNQNNATEKGFFTPFAEQYGFALLCPDTSPRGANIEGEDELWDFGTGAGFYVDATRKPWSRNYKMYSYILEELIPSIQESYDNLDTNTMSIIGHSMGGYGSLMFYLRNPGRFCSCSALAPITNPSIVPWGEKCFGEYLGDDRDAWMNYDPTLLIKKYQGPVSPIMIYQGTADPKREQLLPENFLEASKESAFAGQVEIKYLEGYDHSYYFVSTFAKDHCTFHAKYLGLLGDEK